MWEGAVVTHIISEGNVECDWSLEGTSFCFWYSKSNWINFSIMAFFSTFISEQVELIAFVNAMTCLLRLLAHMRGALLLQSLQQAREASLLGLVAFDRFRCSVTQWWYLAVAWAEVRPKPYTFCQNQGLFADTMCSQNKGTITYPFFSEALCNDSEQNG